MPSSSSLSRTQLDQLAQLGARARLEQLQAEVAALQRILGGKSAGAPAAATKAPGRRRRGKISAAGRAAISAAQKARWAKIKSSKPAEAPARKRSKMSAAARKAVSLRMKKYWAARRKAKAKAA